MFGEFGEFFGEFLWANSPNFYKINLGVINYMFKDLIAECTDYDFKASLEEFKPESWLKSVSAFANGVGGEIFSGINNDKEIVGVDKPQIVIKKISDLIDKYITPKILFKINPYEENNKAFICLSISPGTSTPYYYHHEGTKSAFIRQGSSSIECPNYILIELILKGTGKTYDSILTGYKKDDFSFSILENDFLEKTGTKFSKEDFISFNLANKEGYLTNCGVLLADTNNYRQSRIFCTRWNGKNKTNEQEALDDKEYDGSIIRQLRLAMDFFKSHTNVKWHKSNNQTVYEADYSEEAILEALVNAIIHRNYNNLGAEVVMNIYDDRIEITSPGTMASGDPIPKVVDYPFESMRRNPFIADVFYKLGYMNRRGSGLAKITNATSKLFNDKKEHVTYQIRNSFFVVTIDNANYKPLETLDLTERQRNILDYLKSNNSTLTNLSIAFRLDRKTIRKELETLENLNLIESKGATSNKSWRVRSDLI